MKKNLTKIACIVLSFAVVLATIPLFSACNHNKAVQKASKNLNSYALSASFDDMQKKIYAREVVIYKNNTGCEQTEIWFHLYGRAFRKDAKFVPYSATSVAKCFPNGLDYGDMSVNSVLVDGEEVESFYGGEDEDILIVKTFVPQNKIATIEMNFCLSLAECTHRLGYYENNVNIGNWYPVLCVFENGHYVADPYYSTGDPFYSECSNYEVEFSYPAEYVLGASGNIISEELKDGMRTTKITAKAVRDFSLILGTEFEKKSVTLDEITITYLGYAGDNDLDKNLETAKRATSLFCELFGKYPYKSLTVAKTPFLFGGMEYPNLVWIADNITDDIEIAKVIVHEIAHQWWYGLVGNNEIEHSYIDEALAEYSTVLFFDLTDSYGYSGRQMVEDAALSYELYEEVVHSIKGTVNDRLNKKTTEFSTEYEYVYVVYVRGTLFLDSLKDKIGEKDFLKALRAYCKKFSFKIATRDDFLNAFSKASGDDLSDFFEQWKA